METNLKKTDGNYYVTACHFYFTEAESGSPGRDMVQEEEIENMQNELLSYLENDARLNADNIDVVVKDKIAHLLGTVNTDAELKLAEDIIKIASGKIAGIQNNLCVWPGFTNGNPGRKVHQ